MTVSLSDYLETAYQPDCEYIDGELIERNVADFDHGRFQILLSRYLSNRKQQWNIAVLSGQRMQVKETRYRVPDITVIAGAPPPTQIVQGPPLLCIEVLSPRDSADSVQDKVDDYLWFGVRHVWVVSPRKLCAFEYTSAGMRRARNGILQTENPDIMVPLMEIENL